MASTALCKVLPLGLGLLLTAPITPTALGAPQGVPYLDLQGERETFIPYFDEAYRAYPSIPGGILEAMAFVGSRWSHRIPEAAFAGHHGMPQAYGVMGLFAGQGNFGDVLGDAASAIGATREALIESPRLQILGTAALIDAKLEQAGLHQPSLESMTDILRGLSGLPEGGAIARYAQDSYVYDVLLALDVGHDEDGLRVPTRSIDWDAAFNEGALLLQRAPHVRAFTDSDRLEAVGHGVVMDVTQGKAEVNQGAETAAIASQDYPPADWVSSPNYSSRAGTSISAITIHTVQGSYSGCISWFQNPSSNVSSHYVIRSSDGAVTQMVLESNKAWHVGSENSYTIGIEHEGYVDTSAYYTNAMYASSSDLSKDICRDRGVNCNTCYDGPAHSGIVTLASEYRVKGHQHYPNSNHNDPGVYWDWERYAGLVSGGGSGGGCSTSGEGSGHIGWALLLGLAFLGRRRD